MTMSSLSPNFAPESLEEDRYSRFRLIPWWDQAKIRSTNVLVVGAGALGNEILKNLSLVGCEKIVAVDSDRIERSNLSRAVLFRDEQVGKYKVDAAAETVRSLLSTSKIRPLVGNVLFDCGLGLFAWSDVIIAGLDNREARLWINRAAWKTNRPWIDGAIEGINGVARVFLPGAPPCYECTLGETDWALLQRRMSCNLLMYEGTAEGKVPTTPTIASIIAGIQVQEAIKWIHGLPTLSGRGLVFEGLNHTSYVVQYTENPQCMSHDRLERILEIPQGSHELTLDGLLQIARAGLGAQDVVIEFSREIIHGLQCPACSAFEEVFAPVGKVTTQQGKCARDGHMRAVVTIHGYSGVESFGSRTLDRLGLPLFDIFTARSSSLEISYLITGDRKQVLGPLSSADSA
jgi:molybdopterin/thiamine biosynthesis adenylyltransferase